MPRKSIFARYPPYFSKDNLDTALEKSIVLEYAEFLLGTHLEEHVTMESMCYYKVLQ